MNTEKKKKNSPQKRILLHNCTHFENYTILFVCRWRHSHSLCIESDTEH